MSAFSAAPTLARLKDFQRRSVDYVFRRLYLDDPPASRFLVADEVGLGKTMVARGVIARAIEHLEDRVERIDVVYVCSNAAIAHQNVNRLNVLGKGNFSMASRLTLLPTQVHNLKKNKVNFVSFTPGTTFDLKSRSGTMFERSVIFRILRGVGVDPDGLLHLLQGPAGRSGWEHCARGWEYPLDEELSASFANAVGNDPGLYGRLAETAVRFRSYRNDVPWPESHARYQLIGQLRQTLAGVCLNALEPDLIILDEFQRFRNLLRHDDPTAELAQSLFAYPGARVLLLSATPYKMYSLDHEQDDDHYPDFLKTLRFLFGSDTAVAEVEADIRAFREALLDLDPERPNDVGACRDRLTDRLRAVMCRTERVAHTARQDAMVVEPVCPAPLLAGDLHHATLLDAVSRVVRARDPVEYWKSAPHALSFMKGYELRRNMAALGPEAKSKLASTLAPHGGELLRTEDFASYQPADLANARLRSLHEQTLGRGLGRLLWLPPSLPYWEPQGAWLDAPGVTKALVFSAWNAVPDAIAALLSYEAERAAVAGLGTGVRQPDLHDVVKPLLRYSLDAEGRRTGMPALLLQYPSAALADAIDPLAEALAGAPSVDGLLAAVAARLELELEALSAGEATVRDDERWYWAAPAMLDALRFPSRRDWVAADGGWRSTDGESGAAFREHVDTFLAAMRGSLEPALGRRPEDLARVLSELALAGPATCALRALRRVAPELTLDDGSLATAAATVGAGFRTLFNVPETLALLRSDGAEGRYWRLVLAAGLDGNLPALLDEQVHVLLESLGQADAPAPHRVKAVAAELKESLSIRTSRIGVDELRSEDGVVDLQEFNLRCRFALRFGELRDEKSEARVETLRSAFNSPFRPFVLASTSVGQEGLDFHLWCHAVVHWNLPSNPVDLEQREGRVHRFKGHAVRKNVARELGLPYLRDHWRPGLDPWRVLFEGARSARGSDLLAYWLFETEGGANVERRVPLLPLSRDADQLVRLKHGLALYRLVFGQPRQEDLVAHLRDRLTDAQIEQAVKEWRIDLGPPRE